MVVKLLFCVSVVLKKVCVFVRLLLVMCLVL